MRTLLKPMMLAGILLAAFGIVTLVVRDFRFTSRRKAIDSPSVTATVRNERLVHVPAAVSLAAFAGGLALMVAAARK